MALCTNSINLDNLSWLLCGLFPQALHFEWCGTSCDHRSLETRPLSPGQRTGLEVRLQRARVVSALDLIFQQLWRQSPLWTFQTLCKCLCWGMNRTLQDSHHCQLTNPLKSRRFSQISLRFPAPKEFESKCTTHRNRILMDLCTRKMRRICLSVTRTGSSKNALRAWKALAANITHQCWT